MACGGLGGSDTGSGSGTGTGTGSESGSGTGSATVHSLPPPRPKSPPDLYGRRKEKARLQLLEREIGYLQEELKYVEGLEPASRCCKEVVDFVSAHPILLSQQTRKSANPAACGNGYADRHASVNHRSAAAQGVVQQGVSNYPNAVVVISRGAVHAAPAVHYRNVVAGAIPASAAPAAVQQMFVREIVAVSS